MKTRSAIKLKEPEVLTDYGGSPKRHAIPQDASPDIKAPAQKRRKQVQMKTSSEREDVGRREISFNAMATIDQQQELKRLETKRNFTLHAYVPNREQAVRPERKRQRKSVRFEDRAFTANEQLGEDTERSMSELDGVLPEDVFEDANLASIDIAREKDGEEMICGNGRENESADGEENYPNPVARRVSGSIVVTQTDVVSTKINPFAKSTSQPEIPPENLDIKKRYGALKIEAWQWAIKHFPKVPNSAKASLSLLQLSETSPELIEYVNYISACTDHDWLYVFNELRPKLVFGILGKMLEVHVFGHEMFGATSEQLQKLQEKDLAEMNADALHRHTHRLATLLTFNLPSTAPQNIISSLSHLQASFLLLLTPLLPPTPPPPSLSTSLSHILHTATTLSLHTRRHNPQTLYHFSPHPPIGSPFSPQTMHPLNPAQLAHDNISRLSTDTLVVTMAGWPALIAYTSTPARTHTHHRVLARAEVLLAYGPTIKPLSVQPENWLGRSLSDEVERCREWEWRQRVERRAVLAAGVCTGVGLLGLWVGGRARGFGGTAGREM